MSNTIATSTGALLESPSFARGISTEKGWARVSFISLWVCLAVAVLVRAWLIIHTHGLMDGDEATLGIQAEHILRGERPIYYYGQPYMGSLEAYLVAFVFLFTGPTVWGMRLEALLLCLVIVYLTRRFAAILADVAHLSARLKTIFVVIATLIAAFPPLYDVVEELRVKGGYTEAFLLMLLLLMSAFRLTRRWYEQAPVRELILRWLGIGFLTGLGLWVDPIISYALAAIVLWLGGYFFWQLVTLRRQGQWDRLQQHAREGCLCAATLPAAAVGFTPGLIWGAQNHWANIKYMFSSGGGDGSFTLARLHDILRVQKVYVTCLAPRAMGGALPTQPDVTQANAHILTFGLIVVGLGLAANIGCAIFSWTARTPWALAIRRLTSLSLIFFFCASFIFCFAAISVGAIRAGCGPVDYVGRYTVPLVVVIPFIVAAALVLPLMMLEAREQVPEQSSEARARRTVRDGSSWSRAIQATLLVILAAYLATQGVAYLQADPTYTFHPTACVAENPADPTPFINYMRREHIRYAWSTFWIGSPIIFETNDGIIATEHPGRIQSYSDETMRADRPSILLLARHGDMHPPFLQALDANHVIYRVARFYSEPGVDMLVVTPLNKTVSPVDPAYSSLFKKILRGCL